MIIDRAINFSKKLITEIDEFEGKTIKKVGYLDKGDDGELLTFVFSDNTFATVDNELNPIDEDNLINGYLDYDELFKLDLIDENEMEFLSTLDVIDDLELNNEELERVYKVLKRGFDFV